MDGLDAAIFCEDRKSREHVLLFAQFTHKKEAWSVR
jgi:hypothetical protein